MPFVSSLSLKTRILLVVFLLIASVSFSWSPSVRAKGQIWYVQASARGKQTGTSWENAFPLLQTALARAKAGDQIWVAAGVYTPSDKLDQMASF